MAASDLVKEWKAKAEQRTAERQAAQISVPVTFAGFTGKAHRLLLMDWARGGKLPQYLSSAMFAAVQGKTVVEKKKADLTPEELTEWLKFQRVAFCAMMDEPKFVSDDRELADDEMDYGEFVSMCPEAVNEAIQWQLDGCPDIPIQTESGEVSVEDLRSFRAGGELPAPSESGFNSEGVWWDTKPSVRHL